ncbi:MAG: hypothetical protein ACLQUY_10130 [Ktedonobacterales bacterium]
MPQQPELPEYTACSQCGEYARAALRRVNSVVVCRNCAGRTHPQRHCAICWRIAPSEQHHVASKRQQVTLTLPVCLNCHAILSQRQYRWPHDWRTEAHQLRCVIQGVYDVLCLWLERSPVAECCRDLFLMLEQAALIVLSYLRPQALIDLDHLTDWSAL